MKLDSYIPVKLIVLSAKILFSSHNDETSIQDNLLITLRDDIAVFLFAKLSQPAPFNPPAEFSS